MDNRVLYGVLTILFNQIGVPCFLRGDVKKGIIRLVLAIIPIVGWVIAIINFVKGIILGIKILKMTDEEFAAQKDTLDDGIPA